MRAEENRAGRRGARLRNAVLGGLLFLLDSAALSAPDPEGTGDFPRLLEGHEPTYLIFVPKPKPHLTFLLSVKYPLELAGFRAAGDKGLGPTFLSRLHFYLTYAAKYDFYLGSRYSEPVLLRMHNPGLELQYELDQVSSRAFKSLSVGYYHESNGQIIDTRALYEAAGPLALEGVSRGWDYAGTDLRFLWPHIKAFGGKEAKLNLFFRGRIYLPKQLGGAKTEQGVFWDERHAGSSIKNYDGVRVILALRTTVLNFSAQIRSGYAGPRLNASLTGQFSYRLYHRLPLTLVVFRGYGRDISSYHLFDTYCGIGLDLW